MLVKIDIKLLSITAIFLSALRLVHVSTNIASPADISAKTEDADLNRTLIRIVRAVAAMNTVQGIQIVRRIHYTDFTIHLILHHSV